MRTLYWPLLQQLANAVAELLTWLLLLVCEAAPLLRFM